MLHLNILLARKRRGYPSPNLWNHKWEGWLLWLIPVRSNTWQPNFWLVRLIVKGQRCCPPKCLPVQVLIRHEWRTIRRDCETQLLIKDWGMHNWWRKCLDLISGLEQILHHRVIKYANRAGNRDRVADTRTSVYRPRVRAFDWAWVTGRLNGISCPFRFICCVLVDRCTHG